jgi:hypothetical protein
MKHSNRWLAVAAMLFTSLIGTSPVVAGDYRPRSEVIIEWNTLLQQFQGGQPFPQSRGYAMLHVAMADAVIAIEGNYEPFQIRTHASSAASAEAAAAQAGHDVFYALIASLEGRAAADAALLARLDKIPLAARSKGTAIGMKVAAEVVASRLNDGYLTANPVPATLGASTLPGIWRPTPSGAYQYSDMGAVQPFALLTPTQFLPAPFPQLESAAYATDLNEVKLLGRTIAPDRTEAQTRFAQLFAASPGSIHVNVTNPFRLWSNVARDLTRKHELSLVRTARLFALTLVSMHDSLLTSQNSKEVYRLWRPETAIKNAGIDDNPETVADPDWTPLVTTPPYPAYASNMTCLGAGSARMLANVLGDDSQEFAATWYRADGSVVWSQPYTSLWQLGDDAANSRIWGGIHFGFDIDASQVSCTQVADYIFENRMRRSRY